MKRIETLSKTQNFPRASFTRASILALLTGELSSGCTPYSSRCPNGNDDPNTFCYPADTIRTDSTRDGQEIADNNVVDATQDIVDSALMETSTDVGDAAAPIDVTSADQYDAISEISDVVSEDSNFNDGGRDSTPDSPTSTLSCSMMSISSGSIRVGEAATIRLFTFNSIPGDAPLSYFFGNLPAAPTNMVRSGVATYTVTAQNPPGPGSYAISGWVTSPGGRRADCPSRRLEVTP